MKQVTGISRLRSRAGFTLLELVLATLISSLVIAIMSVSLSFSLRIWERNQNRQPDDAPRLMELMRWQLANFDPVQVRTEEARELIFRGDEQSITFTTDRSVRAISSGAPVVARYVFVPSEKQLFYAEIPLDPYHGDVVQKFIEMKPSDSESWPRFYPTPMEAFALSYAPEEGKGESAAAWDDPEAIPQYVMVNWRSSSGDAASSQLMIPNSLFPKKAQQDNALAPLDDGDLDL